MRNVDLPLCRRSVWCLAAIVALSLVAVTGPEKGARACGCLVPPALAVPLVQAGEEILFVVENGRIMMHVKIRYSGPAGDFGWLMPLPTIPQNSAGAQGIDIGSDELFVQLGQRTQPVYTLRPDFCQRRQIATGCGTEGSGGDSVIIDPSRSFEMAASSPLVSESSVGPYDYAILKADDKSAMLAWLSTNRYVVPTGTDNVVDSYIRPGAYFLALKLTAGKMAGDLQPVVLSYPADLPMIPIVLTSVGASRDMGILVFILGQARAIPRNYQHVVLNDAQLEVLNQIQNYGSVVTRAVGEATNKHGFVTDYAGGSSIMANILDAPGRFAALQSVMTTTNPADFIALILQQQTAGSPLVSGGFTANGQFYAVVGAHVPLPQQLRNEGVTPDVYYQRIYRYLVEDRAARPAAYADIAAKLAAFDPAALRRDLTDRIVTPTLRAGELFTSGRFAKLTRLYTTLSPEDMTADPVFGFNAELPDVANLHTGDVYYGCDNGAEVTTESQLRVRYAPEELSRRMPRPFVGPSALRIERLSEVGMPEVLTDNTEAIKDALDMAGSPQGCAAAVPSRRNSAAPYLALGAAMLLVLRFMARRRRARR